MAGPNTLSRRTEKQFTVLTVFIFWSSGDLRRRGENHIYLLRLNFSISGMRSFGAISSHSGFPTPPWPSLEQVRRGAGTWRERGEGKRGTNRERM